MLTASCESSIAPIKLSSASIALGGMRPPPGACRVRSDSICVIRPQWSRVGVVCNKNNNVGKCLCTNHTNLMISFHCDLGRIMAHHRPNTERCGHEHAGPRCQD